MGERHKDGRDLDGRGDDSVRRRVDDYVRKAPAFARPILAHLRSLVHDTCPAVRETIRWGVPHFEYKGRLCSMAALDGYVAFGFPNRARLETEALDAGPGSVERVTTLTDLPADDTVRALIAQAARLNEERGGSARSATRAREIPYDVRVALRHDSQARAAFDALPPNLQLEYVEWVAGTRRRATREHRLTQLMARLKKEETVG